MKNGHIEGNASEKGEEHLWSLLHCLPSLGLFTYYPVPGYNCLDSDFCTHISVQLTAPRLIFTNPPFAYIIYRLYLH